jgi:hypothetical protein
VPGDAPHERVITGERLKCSKAPISRRGRQGIDLRPDTPACALYQASQPEQAAAVLDDPDLPAVSPAAAAPVRATLTQGAGLA